MTLHRPRTHQSTPTQPVYPSAGILLPWPAVRETAAAYGSDPAEPGFPEAGKVHELLKALHGIGNEVRLRFVDALRTLHDGNLCLELGYSSFLQYCDRELGMARSTSLEYLRVANALDDLQRLRTLYGQGELSWAQVRAITRVANANTEIPWIELAFDEPVKNLLSEVREARRTGRDAPRDRRHGLPNLLVRMSLDLTLEEKERVRAAFELVGSRLEQDLGGGPGDDMGGRCGGDVGPRPPLVRWADGILSGLIPAGPSAQDRGNIGAAERPEPAQTILYRTCPECRESTLDTDEGPLSVRPERVDELAAVANRVTIAAREEEPQEVLPAGQTDEPNSPRLARQVVHRDGLRCANPGCERSRNLHAHHIVFRAQGGRTALSNEVAVCETCHALLHKGLLEVTGSPDTGLTWQPRPFATGVQVRDAAVLREQLHALGTELGIEARTVAGIEGGIGPGIERETGLGNERETEPGTQAAPNRGQSQPPEPGTHESTGVDSGGRAEDLLPSSAGQRAAPTSTWVDARSWAGSATAGPAGSPVPQPPRHGCTPERVRDLSEGLVRLGCSRREGERLVRLAIATLAAARASDPANSDAPDPLDDAAVFTQALRM